MKQIPIFRVTGTFLVLVFLCSVLFGCGGTGSAADDAYLTQVTASVTEAQSLIDEMISFSNEMTEATGTFSENKDMPETNFSPAIEERQGLLKDFVCLFKLNLGFVKGAPVLLALLAITLCGGLASEGFDRLSTAHFLDDTVIPVIGPLNSVTWFGVISLIGSGLGILASQLLIARMEKKGTVSRTSVVMSTSAGYILFLVLFAVGRSFWFMLLVFLLAGLMRTIKEPVLAAWMNDHVDEKMRATVFSTSGQLDSFGQIIGGPIVGLVAQQVSIPWGLVCTAFLLLPALFLVPVAGKKRD